MKRFGSVLFLVALAVALISCGGQEPLAPPPVPDTGGHPGETYSLDTQARALLGGCTSTITYSVVEAGGGIVSAAGVYTAPACAAVTYPVVYHVQASGCALSAQIPVTLDEAVTSVKIVCAIVPPSTACQDPALGLTGPPGLQAQFYAKVALTCHSVFQPTIPAGACTAAFCQ
jgi:hypothetical protein